MTRRYLGRPCADCGVGTCKINEYYMVKDDVWEQAWAGRRKPWHALDGEILCIGCLEKRIGRTLMCCDFTDAPINNPNQDDISGRLRDRLTLDKRSAARADAKKAILARCEASTGCPRIDRDD
jgi:hypothetical protein